MPKHPTHCGPPGGRRMRGTSIRVSVSSSRQVFISFCFAGRMVVTICLKTLFSRPFELVSQEFDKDGCMCVRTLVYRIGGQRPKCILLISCVLCVFPVKRGLSRLMKDFTCHLRGNEQDIDLRYQNSFLPFPLLNPKAGIAHPHTPGRRCLSL